MEVRLSEAISGRCEGIQRHEDERCDAVQAHFTARCDSIQDQVDVVALWGEERLIALEAMKSDVDLWRPDLEKRIDDIALEVTRVNKFFERDHRSASATKPGIFGAYESASTRPTAGLNHADGPYGHRYEHDPREHEPRHAFAKARSPVKGTFTGLPSRTAGFMPEQFYPHEYPQDLGRSAYGRLPKLDFPHFDGNQPQLWKSRCEKYFCMYETEHCMWIKVSTMHFEGRAAQWLQSVECRLHMLSWEEFCGLIHERFGREQHESLIRQPFHIRQTGSVPDYVEQFSSLVHELASYESRTDPLYYTMRFVDGLKHDTKSIVMVQRPTNLDTACALALV